VTVIANTTKTILISVDLSELRVAVLEEGRTVETYIERRGAGSIAGNIYKAKIDNILPAIDAAFVDFGAPKNGFLQVRDVVVPGVSATARRRKKISDMLSNGQDILVQIEKNPMKTKGARVTMELSIAGRFLVLTPDGEGWLILSDIAEHLGLRTRDELLAAFVAAKLRVVGRSEIRPRHPRAADMMDPLHAARAVEVTSLWRLAAA
jgi:Rne/Rng family ribonuclease